MLGFSSRYLAVIDDKGRVVLPAPFKKTMGELAGDPVVIEKDIFKKCLNIYPEKYFEERVQELISDLDQFDEADDELLEDFYQNFISVRMAENGRINLPDAFQRYGNFNRNVVFIGLGKFIRMWAEETFTEREAQKEPLGKKLKEHKQNKNGKGE